MRDRKKPEEPQEEGSPAWMNTYGDMVTLLLTFFVLLFSFSTVDAEKWEGVANSLAGMQVVAIPALDPNATQDTVDYEYKAGKFIITATASGDEEDEGSADTGENALSENAVIIRFNELYEKIKEHIEDNNLGYILNITYVDEYTILLRMSDSAFFDSGEATLDEDAKAALNEVCGIIEDYTDLIHTIRIEGNTDNMPIRNAHYADNWELSMDRADTVRRYILKISDIDPSLLVACYYGEYNPIASNDTEEGRAQNRRVDFIIENTLKVD